MSEGCERDEGGLEEDQALQSLERGCFAEFGNGFKWVGG